ncbi:MAG: glutamate--tRNA ligase [Candidatus Aenigmatarchaeota archaeon]
MLSQKDKDVVLRFCLQNAILHNGKADEKAVLSKVLGTRPELRVKIDELRKEINKIIKDINKLDISKQKEKLEKIAPELLEKEKEKFELPDIKTKEKFVTRFAPSPTGPLNIFHFLRPVYIPYYYAKKYHGIWILRFDDTDPARIERQFYDFIIEDLRNFGIIPDKIIYQSDSIEDCYSKAKKLLDEKKAYICTCPVEKFKELKERKINCPCRDGRHAKLWSEILTGKIKEGHAVVRLKTSMQSPNPAIRDPPLLRIIEAEHPRKGKKYKLWPVYNFASVICDHNEGITHIFRGKEHEHNTEIQKMIYSALGWDTPSVINFGMIYFPTEKMHTRDIKRAIKEGKLKGWDDPRLPTLRALLRRGFDPEALKQLSLKIGLTKTDIKLGWENIEAFNRKIIDPKSNRYFFVPNPVRISIDGIKTKEVKLKLHPDFGERGERVIPVERDRIYIDRSDWEKMQGKEIRLIGLCNIRLKGDKGECTGLEIKKEIQKIQWVSEPHLNLRLIRPEGEISGFCEPDLVKVEIGKTVQLERIGFGRVDAKNSEIVIYWAHQ